MRDRRLANRANHRMASLVLTVNPVRVLEGPRKRGHAHISVDVAPLDAPARTKTKAAPAATLPRKSSGTVYPVPSTVGHRVDMCLFLNGLQAPPLPRRLIFLYAGMLWTSSPCPPCLARAERAGDEPASVRFCPLVQNAGCGHLHHAHCVGSHNTAAPASCPSGCLVARFPREDTNSQAFEPHLIIAWDGDKKNRQDPRSLGSS
ncbi:hypothetical protein B0H19DRAFT_1384995 [Mycena capillaripes]|nr:hypothetical protein B0H19DRAFT_1384995 [Mycena capillaripes]